MHRGENINQIRIGSRKREKAKQWDRNETGCAMGSKIGEGKRERERGECGGVGKEGEDRKEREGIGKV
jgi:hypothetical protein